MGRLLSVCIILLALWTCKAAGTTEKILLVPTQMNSHMMEVGHAVSELPKRGYELHMVVSETTKVPTNILSHGINVMRYKTRHSVMPYVRKDFVSGGVNASLTTSPDDDVEWLSGVTGYIMEDCKEMMADTDLVSKIKSMNFHIAVVDSFFLCPCVAILPYNLSIPFVTIGSDCVPYYHGNPALPSFVPNLFTAFSDSMTFTERLRNSFTTLMMMKPSFPGQTDISLLSEYGHLPRDQGRMIFEIPRESVMRIVNSDPILAYAIPPIPIMKFAGGLSTTPAKPLPKDLESLMSDSERGVILVSFGSIASFLPNHITKKFVQVFSRMEYTIIWRFDGDIPYTLGKNVHVRKWLPQNDILGHPKTKLFITHSGNNGQFEALYHGVPMVAFYLWGDQKHNAYRIERKGFGLKGNLIDFTPNELFEKMNEVLTNKKYRNSIQRASKIYRDQPMTARETSAFWIEHVLKYGSDHLKSGATDLPWYAYLMLDIALLVLTSVVIFIIIIILLLYFLLRRCRASDINPDKKNQ